MSRYDGLIIPRSYSEYINKTDAATLSQALALPGVMDAAPTENSNKAARSGGIYNAIDAVKPVDTVTLNNMHSVTSNAVAEKFKSYTKYVEPDIVLYDGKGSYTATEDCYATYLCVSSSAITFEVNGADVSRHDNASGICVSVFFGHFKKGTTFSSIGRYVIYSLIA